MELPMWHDSWAYRESIGHAIGWSMITALASLQLSLPIMLVTGVMGGAVGWFRGRNKSD
jgi:hypothetical protein